MIVGVAATCPPRPRCSLASHDSPLRGFVLSEGVNPYYSDIDTHAMAAAVVDEAVRRQLCAGARLDRIALLDNFCWPDPVQSEGTPDGAYKLAQLVRACRGLYETTRAYDTPLISGKDSMKNDVGDGGRQDQRAADPAGLRDRADRRRASGDGRWSRRLWTTWSFCSARPATRPAGRRVPALAGRAGRARSPPSASCGRTWATRSRGSTSKKTLPLYRRLSRGDREWLGSFGRHAGDGRLGPGLCADSSMAGEIGLELDLEGCTRPRAG